MTPTVDWDHILNALTPWEDRGGRWYKREDYCAPLGYGKVNGAKFRQCLYLLERAADHGLPGITTGASVLSPQLPMSAVIAEYVGLPLRIYIGGTTLDKATRHRNVQIALEHGAEFRTLKVGYNPALQSAVTKDVAETGRYHLRYGISPDPSDEDIIEFHRVGAAQVQNIPQSLRHLVIPCGSANSTISILLGLSLYPHNVETVTLIGIGPNRARLIADRLTMFGEQIGASLPVSTEIEMHDLHTPGIVTYGQKVRQSLDGITFHPTYEAKVVNHLLSNPSIAPGFVDGDGTTGLWIIGSEPK